MELDVTDAVESFRNSIECSWPYLLSVSRHDTTGSFIQDWMQSSWERIVEASISPEKHVYIEVYGDGADCNIKSSRVWRPEVLPTTSVYVRYMGNEDLINAMDGSIVTGDMIIDRFAAIDNGWPVVDAPFDYVVLSRTEVTAIPMRDLRYYVII